MKPIHYITLVAFIASMTSIICGFVLEVDYSQKLIGFGVLGLFIVVFPLFSYYRWKGKDQASQVGEQQQYFTLFITIKQQLLFDIR